MPYVTFNVRGLLTGIVPLTVYSDGFLVEWFDGDPSVFASIQFGFIFTPLPYELLLDTSHFQEGKHSLYVRAGIYPGPFVFSTTLDGDHSVQSVILTVSDSSAFLETLYCLVYDATHIDLSKITDIPDGTHITIECPLRNGYLSGTAVECISALASGENVVFFDNDGIPDVDAVRAELNDVSPTQIADYIIQQKIEKTNVYVDHYKKPQATLIQLYEAKLALAAFFTYQSFISGVERALARFPVAAAHQMEKLKEAASELFLIACVSPDKLKLDPFMINTRGALYGRETFFTD